MEFSNGVADHELRQTRLCSFGRVLACMTLGYVALMTSISLWLGSVSFNRASVPMLVATVAFAALWLFLRGAPRSVRFVRAVELSTLFVGTTAFSTTAIVMDLTSSPDMIVRSGITFMILAYAVYVPSTARHTLLVASLMTLPLLGCIFVAFSAWDPALHDPPAAIWRKGEVGDMAYPATIVSAVLWAIAVAIAAGFSQTIYGLRKAMNDIRRLGQYTLEEKLGEGGMGVVYRASHAMLRRPTAIKLLLPHLAGKDALTRFEREVRRTAMLSHPNTVTVFDYGRTTDGVFYYAMELLEGASLDEVVEVDGAQPEERVIHILEQAAASLAEAHDAGLIHRDVKPGNVMVVDRAGIADLVKVLDFGLVKDASIATRGEATTELALSTHETITGTPLYLAPETLTAPEHVDARTDLYALGAVGYWLLTGTHVFSGSTLIEVCGHQLHSVPERPSSRLGIAVAPDLEAVLLACLAKRPEERPASARELRERLRACAAAGAWTQARARPSTIKGSVPPARGGQPPSAAASPISRLLVSTTERAGGVGSSWTCLRRPIHHPSRHIVAVAARVGDHRAALLVHRPTRDQPGNTGRAIETRSSRDRCSQARRSHMGAAAESGRPSARRADRARCLELTGAGAAIGE